MPVMGLFSSFFLLADNILKSDSILPKSTQYQFGSLMSKEENITNLSKDEKDFYKSEYEDNKKNPFVYFLFCLCLGFVGGHQYYLGRTVPGILFTLFSWTLIPFFISVFQLFLSNRAVSEYNEELSEEILLRIRANHIEESISLPEVSVNAG